MNKKILLSLLMFSIIMISVGCASAADLNNCSEDLNLGNHLNINSMDDQSVPISSDASVENSDVNDVIKTDENQNVIYFNGSSYFDFVNAVIFSNPGDEIVLLNNVTLDFVCPIPISHPLTIDGNGFTLDIKHSAPAFSVNSPSVTLKNIRFENGNPALKWGNFSGTIKDCIFKSNCDGSGEIIRFIINDNVIRFFDCDCKFNEKDLKAFGIDFINNTIDTSRIISFKGKTFSELAKVLNATNPGDKIILSNNVVQDTSSPLNVHNPITIDGNGFTMDMKYKSEGVFVASPFVTLNNIRFENGCPAIVLSAINVTIKNCIFKNNRGANNGTIRLIGYDYEFNENDFKARGLDFINNYIYVPKVVKFNGTTFTELRKQIETLNENDTLILDNDVYQDTKDDIKIYKPITVDGNGHTLDGKNLYRMFEVFGDNVVLRNINFINGLTAVKWHGNKGTVKGCTFKNIKGYDGGALEWLGCNGLIKNSTFINCKGHNGGAIYIAKDYCKVDGCKFENCTADSCGGAIHVSQFAPFQKAGFETNINRCTFKNCIAKDSGGAIFFGFSTDYSQVKNCTFKQNSAVNGGAIFWKSKYGTVVESLFERNSANNGGAIYWDSEYGTIQKCAFGYNTAVDEAAAINILPKYGKVKIYDCDFYKNKGKNVISHIYEKHTNSALEIKRCNFYFNDASHTIFAGYVTYITNCAFFKNTGENVLDDDFMVHFTWCWFGNTKSNPAANMVKFGHLYPAPIKDPENWYVLGDDFTTSDTMIYDKSKVSFKRISHVKNCDLRLNRNLLVKLISES